MDKEEVLARLLGLSIKFNGHNKWVFEDQDGNVVGTITEFKMHPKNNKKNWAATYAYEVKIDSDKYYVNYTRRINDKEGNILKNDCRYEFDVKTKDENGEECFSQVILILSDEIVCLEKTSRKTGYVKLEADEDRFELDFKKDNLEESVIYNPNFYGYSAKLYKDNKNSDDKKQDYEVLGMQVAVERQNNSWVDYIEQEWHDNELINNYKARIKGTPKEALELHEDGIASFNYFIEYMKSIEEIASLRDPIIEVLKKNKESNVVLKLSNL